MSALIKTLGHDFPMPQSIFIRSVVGILVMLPLLRRSGGWASLRVRHVGWHVVRCCSGLFGTVSSFYGYIMLPLADVMALGFTMPLFLTVLAIPLLGERVGIRRATAVVVGFLGAVLIIRPEGGGETFASLFVLAGAVTWAISMIAIRRLGAMGESPVTIVIWFSAFAAAMSGLLLPFVWQTPTALQWAMLLAIGISGGFGQLFISYAYRAGDVVLLAPFEYMALLWALGADILFWQAAPEWQMLIGAAILVASGLYILHREAKLGLARRRGAAAAGKAAPAGPDAPRADQSPG
ncbi:MAG: DMT family transporter [Alphaproteobacteria bacterium]|nr:DMT family transporter [Alphaproteobacteria bacterium]